MSVIQFGPDELANIARVISEEARDRETTKKRAVECLAIISKANAACYGHRYSEEAKPYSATDIFNALRADKVVSVRGALSVAGLLHYNCEEEIDFLEETEGGIPALLWIMEKLLWVCTDHLSGQKANFK